MSHPLKGATAIAGLGLTPMVGVYDSPMGFAVEAVRLALADAGLDRNDVDGVCVNPGISWRDSAMASYMLQMALGLEDVRYSASMNLGGATAIAMIQNAALAIQAGLCSTVLCVFSDAPLKPPEKRKGAKGSGAAYGGARGLDAAHGQFGVTGRYAMVAQRFMSRFGTTNDHLGAVAVAQRAWANRNEMAQFHDTPLSLDEYRESRWIVEPFRLLDCCLVSNGGAAVVVTSAERARDLRRPPAYVLGVGQGHPGGDPLETLQSGAPLAKKAAFSMAGIEIGDVDVMELYDCYTFTALLTLEDYGVCARGEGGAFYESGATAPGGSLPVNTGGGQLSSFYMWGMTPVSEAVIQSRGDGGERQAERHEVVLASGNGGILWTHSTLVLGTEPG